MRKLRNVAVALSLGLGLLNLGACGGGGGATGGGVTAPTAKGPVNAAGELELHLPAPVVGSAWSKADQQTSNFTITLKSGGAFAISTTSNKIEHVQVLEATPVFPTKLSVHIETDQDVTQTPGGPQSKNSPVAGKAYTVWDDGGTFHASGEGGADVSADELEELTSMFATDVGMNDPMGDIVTGRAWKQGERVVLSADEMAHLNEGRSRKGDKVTGSDGALTWQGLDGDVATFAMEMTVTNDDEHTTLVAAMKGTFTVDVAHVRPLEIKLGGDATGKLKANPAQDPNGMMTDATISGTTAGTTTYTYE